MYGRHDAQTRPTPAARGRCTCDGAKGSEVSPCSLSQNELVQCQIGHRPPQPLVFLLKLLQTLELRPTLPSRHTVSAINRTSVASRRSGAPHPILSSLALAEPQLAEASMLSLRASLVSQPSLILQLVGQNYSSWWITCRGLFQGCIFANPSDVSA